MIISVEFNPIFVVIIVAIVVVGIRISFTENG